MNEQFLLMEYYQIIISVGKEKVQFTFCFYLKPNEEVQLDLQHFKIFIFLSLLLSLQPRKMKEEKLTFKILQFGIRMLSNLIFLKLFPNK